MSQTPVSNLQPSLALTEFVNMQGVFPERDTLEAGAYLGGIETFAGGNEFSSEADGQILPISQDTALFSLMGTFYGGDGRSTFELPNLEGVTMIGAGQGPGLPLYDLGETTGTTSNTLTAAQLPSSLGGASAPVDNMQPSLAVTYYINAVGIYPSQTLTLDSIGVVSAFAGNFAPSGMACDGQLLSISEYEALYTILGTTYGGDGVNTFALPNLNGRDIVGSGPTDQIGTLIGSASDTLTNTNSPTGADAPINNEQPGLVMNYYIMTTGIFPSYDSVATQSSTPELGQVIAFAGTLYSPVGCMLCDGQTLQIAQYQALFAILGTTYGGDGIRTFQLPNLEGRSIVGTGGTNGIGTLGQDSGALTTTLTSSNLPALGAPLLALHSDTGASNTDGITNNGQVDVSGLATGATWSYTVNGGAPTTGTGTSFTLTGSGAKTVGVIQSRGAGDVSGTASLNFTLLTTPPAVTSITTVGASLNDAPSEQFAVTFSESVTGVAASDFALATTGTAAGTIASVTGSGATYTVTVANTVTGEGTLGLDLLANSSGITDLAGNAAVAGFTGQAFTVDPPSTVVSATANTTGPINSGASVTYDVTFSNDIPSYGALQAFEDAITTGTVQIGYVGVSPTSNNSYQVIFSDITGDGTLDWHVGAGEVPDQAGVSLASAYASGDVVTIENTPPAVTSITTVGASVNDAPSEQFAVTFSESVTGVAASDFALATTGTASGTIASVTGSGATYTVTVANTVTGEGTLGLNLDANSSGITDGAGNAAIAGFTGESYTVTQAPCYCLGVMIATERGAVAVENLIIGDHVKTVSGAARPIKWIGTRSFDGRFVGGNRDILPICIQAGALGHDIPDRDLWVSPHHALYLEGVLIEAKDLVNGVSIFQAERVERVEYFHIELFSHDVIIANGAEAETFIDNDSRAMFQNAGDYLALYPNSSARRRASSFAPRRDEGFEIEAARLKIAARAGISAETASPGDLSGWVDDLSPEILSGWARDFSNSEIPVHLHVHADGCLIGRVLANKFRADLMAATGGAGRNGFIFAAPKGVDFSKVRIELRRASDGAVLPCPAQFAA